MATAKLGYSYVAVYLLMGLGGCEKPFDRVPPELVNACYGGIENWKRNWICSEHRQILTLPGDSGSWVHLEGILREIGYRHELQVFGGIEHKPGYIDILDVQICSEKGLYLLVDDRVYEDDRFNRDLDTIQIVLLTYDDAFRWEPLADDLVQTLEQQWPEPVVVEYPAPRGNREVPSDVGSCG